MQQRQNQLQALGQAGQIGTQQAGMAQQGAQAQTGAALQGQQNALTSIANTNAARAGVTSQANQINANANAANAAAQNQLTGNLMGAIGTGVGAIAGGPIGAAIGSGVGRMFAGSPTAPTTGGTATGAAGMQNSPIVQPVNALAKGGMIGPQSHVTKHFMMAKGGQVPALVSPGETYLSPSQVNQVKSGANPLAVGEKIPGKPSHPGNDYRNDTVKATLQEGGVVIPNSIMQSKDASKKAAAFVEAILARKGK